MRESQKYLEARLGGVLLNVPILGSLSRTQVIVDKVNTKLHEIETASTRIDTQKFALLAAFHFAAELQDLTEAHVEEDKQLARSLEQLNVQIQELVSLIRELGGVTE